MFLRSLARFGVDARVVSIAGFQHPDQHSCFAHIEAIGFLFKKSFCCVADAIHIVAKRNSIQVKGNDFSFGKVAFQLDGNDGFFQFLDDAFHRVAAVIGKQVFSRLHGDGTCTAFATQREMPRVPAPARLCRCVCKTVRLQ